MVCVFHCSFAESGATNLTSYPLNFVCNGNEMNFHGCYMSTGKVCSQSADESSQLEIAVECDSKYIIGR